MSENVTSEPCHVELEREVSNIVCQFHWDRMWFTIHGMGISSSDARQIDQKLERLTEIAVLLDPEAVGRAKEEGHRRHREEVAGHIRGCVPDAAVNAWLAEEYNVRQWHLVR